MGFIDDQIASDDAFFLSADGPFTEPVIYKPRVGGQGTWRTIYAEVKRNPPRTPAELQRGLTPAISITVRIDPTAGINPAALDIGGDKIAVALRVGGASQDILLNEPHASDAGRLVFRIGA